ncbi:AB hydrolase superfamily protein [Lachnellula hyalina]|uniref:AB hydrolase superfamily protein n=1 Tax=Lachnellula hyalina TaxID=1316788 RepID=A0A8H8QVK0_9HELO|nr:AB hydrolase superfamily protein [Lachnellula hyalina]TVY23326.1 AB hydrolase superfamily protein [Lachnellula hyalina]
MTSNAEPQGPGSGPQPPYPLHPSIQDKLDPVYAAFYNKHLINQQQVHLRPVSASRTSGVLIPGAGPELPVGKVEDISIKRRETEGPDVLVRAFTPEGEKPEKGWPLMVYYHGGGWVLGNINTENVVCTNLCNRAKCVVVTVDYRLAPEDPYPAAVHDSWEALLWLNAEGPAHLSLDLSRSAVGGSSAGGNLAAIMCHKALSAPSLVPKFSTQLLLVPVMDNTALPSTTLSWKENEFTPALPAEKMLWYRRHYLPDEKTWGEPEASPLLYGNGSGEWGRLPRALIVVGELDVLRSEGEEYAAKLEENGVKADLKIMKGMPHPFLAMDGALQQGKDAITFMVEALKDAFGGEK